MKHVRISSELKNMRAVSSEIIDYIKKINNNVSKSILFDIKLCVEEALRNAICHGNRSNRDLAVDISYKIFQNTIKISIEDKGDGFDVGSLPDPTDIKNLYKESGRGVYIMHRLMDKVEYSDKGNSVTMEKELN